MEKIASFTIDHIKLKPGVYVSRKDVVGDQIITTFDLRMTSPNDEPVMNIWVLRFSAITRNSAQKPFILDPWDAEQGFICFWPETMNPRRLCH